MEPNEKAPTPADGEYEPPQVEQVLDPADLTREVHYAGAVGSPGTPG